MISIPETFLKIRYNGEIHPYTDYKKDLTDGSNCQIFAYSILRYFSLEIPDFWSSELWEDTTHTEIVDEFQEFDILLYNNVNQAHSAHVTLFIGEDKIIHLSKAVGYPEIIEYQQFKERERYKYLIGGKRLKAVLHRHPWLSRTRQRG